MTTLSQRSFSVGEIKPSLYGRQDLADYFKGLKTCKNFWINRYGCPENRPGTKMIDWSRYPTKKSVLKPFVFNDDDTQSYMIEFGDKYAEFIQNGGRVVEAGKAITAITQGNPATVTSNAHGFSDGDHVFITGVVGFEFLNGRRFLINGTTANTFDLFDLQTNKISTLGLGPYVSGGTVFRVYKVNTPFAEADLANLRTVQSADKMTLFHPSYWPQELIRSAHTSWILQQMAMGPDVARPAFIQIAGVAGAVPCSYRVHAVDALTGEESLPGLQPVKNITAITQAAQCQVTSNAHGFANGDEIYIDLVSGMTQLNKRVFIVANVTANTFKLKLASAGNAYVDSTGYDAYVSGGTAALDTMSATTLAAPTVPNPILLTWTFVSGISKWNIYKLFNGVFAYIGSATNNSFNDDGSVTPNANVLPPYDRQLFDSPNNWPAAGVYYQSRLFVGGTYNNPDTLYASQPGHYRNFTTRIPTVDSDAITDRLQSSKVSYIRDFQNLGKLVVTTSGGEWVLNGDSAGIVKPSAVNARQQSSEGSANLNMLVVGASALFVQGRGAQVRDFSFDLQVDGFRGGEISIKYAHLFEGYTILGWGYQKIPQSIVWMLRSDGKLVAFTFVREQAFNGAHRHETDGTIESVACIPEGTEYSLYMTVKRSNTQAATPYDVVRFVERLSSRRVSDQTTMNFMDCALSYDGTVAGTAAYQLSSSGGWTFTDTITLTAAVPTWSASDVGKQIVITWPDGFVLRVTITGYTSTTVITGKPDKTVDASHQGAFASLSIARAVKTVTGLDHLLGRNVSVLGDGAVIASPNNSEYGTPLTVTFVGSGFVGVTLPDWYVRITAGLPYTSDVRTLDLENIQGETMIDRRKNVKGVTIHLEKSMGAFVGGAPPTNDSVDPLENLDDIKLRLNENYGQPISLHDGPVYVPIMSRPTQGGEVFIRQVDPIPISILTIAPAGRFPIRAGG